MSEIREEIRRYCYCPGCHSLQPVTGDEKSPRCANCREKIKGLDKQKQVCGYCGSVIYGGSVNLCPCRESRWQSGEEAAFLSEAVRRFNQHRIPGSFSPLEASPGRELIVWADYWLKHSAGDYQCPYIQENGLRCPGLLEGPGYYGRCTVCGMYYHWCATKPGLNKYARVWRHICQECETRQVTTQEDHNLHD